MENSLLKSLKFVKKLFGEEYADAKETPVSQEMDEEWVHIPEGMAEKREKNKKRKRPETDAHWTLGKKKHIAVSVEQVSQRQTHAKKMPTKQETATTGNEITNKDILEQAKTALNKGWLEIKRLTDEFTLQHEIHAEAYKKIEGMKEKTLETKLQMKPIQQATLTNKLGRVCLRMAEELIHMTTKITKCDMPTPKRMEEETVETKLQTEMKSIKQETETVQTEQSSETKIQTKMKPVKQKTATTKRARKHRKQSCEQRIQATAELAGQLNDVRHAAFYQMATEKTQVQTEKQHEYLCIQERVEKPFTDANYFDVPNNETLFAMRIMALRRKMEADYKMKQASQQSKEQIQIPAVLSNIPHVRLVPTLLNPRKMRHEGLDQSTAPTGRELNEQPAFSKSWQFEQDFSKEGGQLQGYNSDVVLSIPPGAIKKGPIVKVKGAVSTDLDRVHKQLRLSHNEKLVSPVIEYNAGFDYSFEKPVRISLPHFIPGEAPYSDVCVYWFNKTNAGFRLQKPILQKLLPDTHEDQTGLQNGVFRFSEPGRIEIVVTHFCGFFCTHCEERSPQLQMRLYGSPCGITETEVIIYLLVWDKRLDIKDFRENYVPKSEEDRKFILTNSMSAPDDTSGLKFGAKLVMEKQVEGLWTHKLMPGVKTPLFPATQEINLTDYKPSCTKSSPMRLDWRLQRKRRVKSGSGFHGYVYVGYIDARRGTSAFRDDLERKILQIVDLEGPTGRAQPPSLDSVPRIVTSLQSCNHLSEEPQAMQVSGAPRPSRTATVTSGRYLGRSSMRRQGKRTSGTSNAQDTGTEAKCTVSGKREQDERSSWTNDPRLPGGSLSNLSTNMNNGENWDDSESTSGDDIQEDLRTLTTHCEELAVSRKQYRQRLEQRGSRNGEPPSIPTGSSGNNAFTQYVQYQPFYNINIDEVHGGRVDFGSQRDLFSGSRAQNRGGQPAVPYTVDDLQQIQELPIAGAQVDHIRADSSRGEMTRMELNERLNNITEVMANALRTEWLDEASESSFSRPVQCLQDVLDLQAAVAVQAFDM